MNFQLRRKGVKEAMGMITIHYQIVSSDGNGLVPMMKSAVMTVVPIMLRNVSTHSDQKSQFL